MATLEDLFKLQRQIESATKKLDAQKTKRRTLIKTLNLNTPGWDGKRAENFVSVDGKLQRLWVDSWGNLELEVIEV